MRIVVKSTDQGYEDVLKSRHVKALIQSKNVAERVRRTKEQADRLMQVKGEERPCPNHDVFNLTKGRIFKPNDRVLS